MIVETVAVQVGQAVSGQGQAAHVRRQCMHGGDGECADLQRVTHATDLKFGGGGGWNSHAVA